MARQSITTQGYAAIAPAILRIAFVGLAVDVQEKIGAAICHVICAAVGELVQALPGILLAAGQALESCALDHTPLFRCVELLMPAGALLHFLVGLV
jgi:hypothetical protein